MEIEGRVGYIFANDGARENVRLGRFGDLLNSELMGRYYANTFRQNHFHASVQAGVTSSVGLATTYTGLVVSNPLGSGKLMVPLMFSLAQSVINAAVNAIGLACGYSGSTNVTHTTPVTPRNNYFGVGASPVCLADVAATLPVAPFYTGPWVADSGTATTNPPGTNIDLGGLFVIPPGGWIMMAAIAASPASALWPSFQWTEVPA
jgi:hypothetical protein